MPPMVSKDLDSPYFSNGLWRSSRNGPKARIRAIRRTQALIRDTLYEARLRYDDSARFYGQYPAVESTPFEPSDYLSRIWSSPAAKRAKISSEFIDIVRTWGLEDHVQIELLPLEVGDHDSSEDQLLERPAIAQPTDPIVAVQLDRIAEVAVWYVTQEQANEKD